MINNTCQTMESDPLFRKIGIKLVLMMPLIWLTNKWELFIIFNEISIRLFDIMFLVILLLLFFQILSCGKIDRHILYYFMLLFYFFLISLLGLMVKDDYQIQWPAFFRFLQTLSWGGISLFFIKNIKHFRNLIINIIISMIIIAISSIYIFLTNPMYHRIAGFFSAAGGEGLGFQASFNEIGALYALALNLSICLLFWSNKKQNKIKYFIIPGIFLILIGLVLVQSRSAFVALFIGSISMLILPEINRFFFFGKVKKKIPIFLSILFLCLIVIFISSNLFLPVNRLLRTAIQGSNEYFSAIKRLSLWENSLKLFFSTILNFFLGYGFRSSFRFIGAESSHNLFINICNWLGFLGLIIFIYIFIWPLLKVIRKINAFSSYIVIATFFVALSVSIFGNVLVDPFYGGCTFLILYGGIGVRKDTNISGEM